MATEKKVRNSTIKFLSEEDFVETDTNWTNYHLGRFKLVKELPFSKNREGVYEQEGLPTIHEENSGLRLKFSSNKNKR